MPDNVTLSQGSQDGAVIATDDIGGVHYQAVKMGLGAGDSFTYLDGNSGNKSNGTLRVVLATDQPALTNKLLVTPDLPSGAATSAKQPALGTAGSASADVITVQGIASMTPLLVNGSGVTQPISHAALTELAAAINSNQVDVNLVASSLGLALESGGNLDDILSALQGTLTVGATDLDIRDLAAAADSVEVHGSEGIIEQLDLTNSNPLVVAIVDGSGDQITSFGGGGGGGTEYTEGDTDASITGPAVLVEGPGNALTPLLVDASQHLQVDIAADSAGLAQESGGNLDAIAASLAGTVAVSLASVPSHAVTNGGTFVVQENGAALTALQVIDDWDESDRAKVNIISGQAGVAAGAGGVGATVQRVVPAGGTPFKFLDVDESEEEIKASAGVLYALYLFNTTNAIVYAKLYDNTASGTTVGTTTPVMTIPVPGNNDTDGGGVIIQTPIAFASGITLAATTAAADNDTGAPGTGALIATGVYS